MPNDRPSIPLQREVARLAVSTAGPSRRDVATLHGALHALRHDVATTEVRHARLGPSTQGALREVQARAGLPQTGELDHATLTRIKDEVHHEHLVRSKYQVGRLQQLLGKAGVPVDGEEATRRTFGPATQQALREFHQQSGIGSPDLVTPEVVDGLRAKALERQLGTKRQVALLQRAVLRAGRIARVPVSIDRTEMAQRQLGPSTQQAVRTLQTHFQLPATGQVDPVTFDRLRSVAASRPVKRAHTPTPDPSALTRVPKALRLNMTNRHVPQLQKALTFLGHPVVESEVHDATFGASTRKAVLAFQATNGIPETGHADGKTLALINQKVAEANPEAAPLPRRLRGTVRDASWVGRAGVTVELRTRPLRGDGVVLASRTTLANGFYDLPYTAPIDPATGHPVSPLDLTVVFREPGGAEIGRKEVFNPTPLAWANYTQGDQPYRGPSDYEARLVAISTAAAGIAVTALVETADQPEISRIAQLTAMTQDDVMRIVLAHRAAAELAEAQLDPPVVYGFLAQSQPPNLPDDLLASTHEWELIDQLVDRVATGLAFADPTIAGQTIDTALTANLVPVTVASRREAILAALAAKRTAYALSKPLLAGNGTLGALLSSTSVRPQAYDAVAQAFVTAGGLGPAFWDALRSRPDDLGGAGAVTDLETTVEVGAVAKNHLPTLTFLKARIADPADTQLRSARDLAKLTVEEWAGLVRQNGDAVPDGTDGATAEEKRATYARTLSTQSERIFPTVAFTAEVARSDATRLTKMPEVVQLIDDHPDLDLRQVNVDAYAAERIPDLDPDVRGDLRVMQRAHRLAPTATAGRALLDQKLHSSSQIVSLGKREVVRRLAASGLDERVALTIHGYAEFQYAQVLNRLAAYRSELYRYDPTVVPDQRISRDDHEELLGRIPDLEELFGPLDSCDCAHCASVYGPAAYLADVLRFLDAHPAEIGDRTVRAVLTERRPDIGTVKLNCPNTETPLPYIDLVCEVLEAAVPGGSGQQDTQTTLAADELRAAPEHQDRAAYDVLRTQDFPLSSCLDLWQEEARVFLDHLGVPRWQLMDAFRDPASATPSDASIAGEYFGICSHETGLVVAEAPTSGQQQVFWFFDTTRDEVGVPEFLDHAHLGYGDLLALLATTWITPDDATERIAVARPVDSSALDQQRVIHLSPAAFDRIHRFLRLWRHVPWDMWQLDLLVRAARIAGGSVDGPALAALRDAARLQARLGATPETLACWFGDALLTEGRPDPTGAGPSAPSLYEALFQNRAVLNPPDPAFTLPLGGSGPLTHHTATLLAALAVTEPELDALVARVGDTMDLPHLAELVRWVTLARATRLGVLDLLALADLLAPTVADPFASPAELLRFLDAYDAIRRSGIVVAELDFLLNLRPDSAYALSDDLVTDFARTLRESLRSNPAADRTGQAAAHVAATFALDEAQAALLLARLTLDGPVAGHLTDAALTQRDAAGHYTHDLTPGQFPALYGSYRLLSKASRLLRAHGVTDTQQTAWLLDHAHGFGALDPSMLPATAAPTAPLFPAWLTLQRWVEVRRALLPTDPAVTTTPEQLVALASDTTSDVAAVRGLAGDLTGFPDADLAALDGGDRASYADMEHLGRLVTCAGQARRLGVSAATCRSWADRDRAAEPTQADVAAEVRQAAKAKYDAAVWLTTVTPLQDALRERKRDGLVAFLIEHSLRTESPTRTVNGKDYVNPRYWRVPDDLLGYFLLDVEMTSVQLTSRIKQAIGSTQLMVQRCFLNLETPDVLISGEERADQASLDSWRQWRWMKSYRMWEANRKVFLYPENWIQPELRDDKSPFFVELENELLQSEITADNAETAVRHYLEKLHEVANLQVVGMYHEVDDDAPYDNLPPTINVVHVVGRTRTEPARYFYRRYDLNLGCWSPWERIDLDITGDHVVPVVYNRALHLFWLVVSEKQQRVTRQPAAQPTATTLDAPEPPKQLEIKLAWSVRRGTGWSARQVSPHTLVHPWQRPLASYNLKPRYKSRENQLWMDLYVSTSLSFNNSTFYDPYAGNRSFVTAFRFDETARPWHSSSFVFDGNVVAVKLKPLRGQYHVLDASGVPSATLVPTTSYAYVRDTAGDSGRMFQPMTGPYEIAPRLALPDGMHYESTRLVNNAWHPNPNRLTVLENGGTVGVLNAAHPPFELAFTQHHVQWDTAAYERSPFFYSDAGRSYFVQSDWITVRIDSSTSVQRLTYTFFPFSHPYTALFLRELNRSGTDGLLNRKIQRFPEQFYPGNAFSFSASYRPDAVAATVDPSGEKDVVDFSRYGAYAGYNWELFFHIPFLVATKLTQNQRFEEAMSWFHHVFDPTDTESLSAPQRFWVTKPFFDASADDYRRERIEELLQTIGQHLDEVRAWKNDPFNPHLIARFRPVAYQKAVVMKYIDNLVAWGDQLFRQDTIEAINEATLLYVLAYELLGRRPEHVPPVPRPDKSYDELTADSGLDPFGNQRVEVLLENFTERPTLVLRPDPDAPPLPHLSTQYFGIPGNDDLLRYWSTVEDRLFKIRHGMSISGAVRQLPLFEPPIDPAVLVRAAAAGVDLASVLADSATIASPYRFRTLLAKAIELCVDVRALGERMLHLLERRDAEGLAQLQSGNDVSLQRALTLVRRQQVDEAARTVEALQKGLDVIDKRVEYYTGIPRMNGWEIAGAVGHGLGIVSEIVATVLNTVGGAASLAPTFTAGAAGFGGSPVAVVTYGGQNVAQSSTNFAALFTGLSAILHSSAQMLETQGGYTRLDDANKFQGELAGKERAQLSAQIAVAEVRTAIAEQELAAHELHVDHVTAVDAYLRGKYTNAALYDWMIGQLSTVYFQAYQLAYDLAKQAERSFRFELGDDGSPAYVQFGYWDSLKKGLLAGDRLVNDLRRLESAYLQGNTRRLELTKHVSLATVAPVQLLQLKSTGSCLVRLPEWLFDLDHPGHYQRRLRNVALSVPCVVGPYTNVNATLSLTRNAVRLVDDMAGGYGDPLAGTDTRFASSMVPVSSIATSHGSGDRGMFELRFDDDRYLPFEGAGAVSEWQITLDPASNQFDLASVTDVVLHLEYTARAGGPALVTGAKGALDATLPTSGARMYVLETEFSGEWYRFLHPDAGTEQTLAFDLAVDSLPFALRRLARTKTLGVTRVDLVLDTPYPGSFDARLARPGAALAAPQGVPKDPAFGGLPHLGVGFPPGTPVLGRWQLQLKRDVDAGFAALPADLVAHAYLLVQFTAS